MSTEPHPPLGELIDARDIPEWNTPEAKLVHGISQIERIVGKNVLRNIAEGRVMDGANAIIMVTSLTQIAGQYAGLLESMKVEPNASE